VKPELSNIFTSLGEGLFQFRFVGNGQFHTAFFATAGQYLAAICCLHTLAKAMHGFTAASMWLECTFHCKDFCFFVALPARNSPALVEREAKLGKKRFPAKS
jgi:hypothetical protein